VPAAEAATEGGEEDDAGAEPLEPVDVEAGGLPPACAVEVDPGAPTPGGRVATPEAGVPVPVAFALGVPLPVGVTLAVLEPLGEAMTVNVGGVVGNAADVGKGAGA
jgi:hypothetical protein